MNTFTIAAVGEDRVAFYNGRSILVVHRPMITSVVYNPHDNTLSIGTDQMRLDEFPNRLADAVEAMVSKSIVQQPFYRSAGQQFGRNRLLEPTLAGIEESKAVPYMMVSEYGSVHFDLTTLNRVTLDTSENRRPEYAHVISIAGFGHCDLWHPTLKHAEDAMEMLFITLTNNRADVIYQSEAE